MHRTSRPAYLGFWLICVLFASPAAAQDPPAGTGQDSEPNSGQNPVLGAEQGLVAAAEEALAEYRPDLDSESSVALSERLVELEGQLAPAGEDSLRSELLEIGGLLYFRRGELDRARELWASGLEAARASADPAQTMALLNMNAVGVSQSGDLESGIQLFHELALMRREHEDTRGEGIAWSNIANANMRLQRLPECMQAVENAQACFEKAEFARGLGNVYILRGNALLEMGRSREALASFDAGVEVARELQQKDLMATALVNRGRTYMLRGEPFEFAIADVDSAVALWEEMDNRHQLLMCRMIRGEVLVETGHFERSLYDLEYVRAEREADGDRLELLPVLDMLGAAHVELGRLEEGEAELRICLALLEELRSETEDESTRLGLYQRGGLAHRDLARCLLLQGLPEEAWAVAERGRAWLLREQLAPLGAGVAAIELGRLEERLAASNAVYVHISESFAGQAFVFIVSADDLQIIDLDLPAGLYADLEMAIYHMSNGSPDELCDPPLARLGEALAGPLIAVLPRDGRTVLVSLPSGMSNLPLDALLVGVGDQRIVFGDEFASALVPSASTWAQLEERSVNSSMVLAFADPTLQMLPDVEFTATRFRDVMGMPLPQARIEAQAVTRRGGRRLEGEQASKVEFMKLDSDEVAVLHFATHAVLDPVHPDQSALLLAGAEDERLTALEIEDHPMHTDLVTLSGCRTGGGLNYVGEGTLGLARSFLVAGARSVVMSRWDVEDAAARRFMESFYAALEEGKSRAEAMKIARATLEAEGFPHRDRSAFVLAGVATEPVLCLANAKEPGLSKTRLLLIAAAVLLLGSLLVQARRRRTSA